MGSPAGGRGVRPGSAATLQDRARGNTSKRETALDRWRKAGRHASDYRFDAATRAQRRFGKRPDLTR